MKKNILHILLLLTAVIWLNGCKNVVDEHNEIVNVDYSTDLFQKIAGQANLSKFTEYVRSTGYDKVLSSSQTYTIWAPTNDALATLDAAIVSDPVKLKDFVANHIGLTATPAPKGVTDTVKVLLQNKKYATMVGPTFEEAAIVGSPAFVKNGALYVIDKAVPTKLNVWDFMLSSTDAALQTNYIANLSTQVIDTANATIIGYNSLGNPIFAPNPPMVSRNTYWNSVADLRIESQQYTFFMLQDATYTTERNRLEPYYPNGSSFILVRDLVVKGLYNLDKLPDTLISTRGVKIPVKKSAIVKSYKASNGIVYVMNALPFRTKDKVPTFKIEGEIPFGFRTDRTGNTLYRLKLDDKGIAYRDIEVYNHGFAEFYIQYLASVAAVKYKVYARVTSGGQGDAQVANFTQRYFIFNSTTLVYDLFATQIVTPLNYTEVYLGDYTPQQFGILQLRLTAANTTSKDQNTLILDYLRFEPILP
jgi:uncharacterized surface protein with fasciclin (FAS1) repeats